MGRIKYVIREAFLSLLLSPAILLLPLVGAKGTMGQCRIPELSSQSHVTTYLCTCTNNLARSVVGAVVSYVIVSTTVTLDEVAVRRISVEVVRSWFGLFSSSPFPPLPLTLVFIPLLIITAALGLFH